MPSNNVHKQVASTDSSAVTCGCSIPAGMGKGRLVSARLHMRGAAITSLNSAVAVQILKSSVAVAECDIGAGQSRTNPDVVEFSMIETGDAHQSQFAYTDEVKITVAAAGEVLDLEIDMEFDPYNIVD